MCIWILILLLLQALLCLLIDLLSWESCTMGEVMQSILSILLMLQIGQTKRTPIWDEMAFEIHEPSEVCYQALLFIHFLQFLWLFHHDFHFAQYLSYWFLCLSCWALETAGTVARTVKNWVHYFCGLKPEGPLSYLILLRKVRRGTKWRMGSLFC